MARSFAIDGRDEREAALGRKARELPSFRLTLHDSILARKGSAVVPTRLILPVGVFGKRIWVTTASPRAGTMGTTTALSRQAVINGAVIKPGKHRADGFRG
jgi:hypothetical protein